MRYIANSDGYLQQVSFGADITCGGTDCAEYTGAVPADYKSLEDWYHQEGEKLYRWKIVDGQLTLDSSATAPGESAAVLCETGTWTASLRGGSITSQRCTYVKAGNMVTISFFISGKGSSGTTASSSYYFYIKGAPFTPDDAATWYGGGGHIQGLNVPSGNSFTGFALTTSNKRIYARLTSTGTASVANYAYDSNGAAEFYVSGSLTYPIT